MHAERVLLDAFRDRTINQQDRISVAIVYPSLWSLEETKFRWAEKAACCDDSSG